MNVPFGKWAVTGLLLLCAGTLVAGAAARAETRPALASSGARRAEATRAEHGGDSCVDCHFCDKPTREEPCLLLICARPMALQDRPGLGADSVPDVIILDELEAAYLPVPFDHRGHAHMAEMARGCATCHHYTPEGLQHPACKTCHDDSAAGTDIHKPGLKGAYHQQCLNCHRDWIDETDCDICHRAKAVSRRTGDLSSPTKDDILGRMHPPIPQPDTDLYGGPNGQAADTPVVFRHGEHVSRFGLGCAECHHESNCIRCHTRGGAEHQPRTLADHHRPCIRCHKQDMTPQGRMAHRCERCHWMADSPKPQPFDHAGTGWPLNRFHDDLGCRSCHATTPFSSPASDCKDCHSAWAAATFDHGVTGQALDDVHATHDCEECHLERRFDQPPECSECHDEDDDGIVFPSQRPGPLQRSD